jgi:hypothetical protein
VKDAVRRIRLALEGIPRGTKFLRRGKVKGHASGGLLAEVSAVDLAEACRLAVPPEGNVKAAELLYGATNAITASADVGDTNPPRVLCEADDLYELLEQIPA